jgi:hypothetical protein
MKNNLQEHGGWPRGVAERYDCGDFVNRLGTERPARPFYPQP